MINFYLWVSVNVVLLNNLTLGGKTHCESNYVSQGTKKLVSDSPGLVDFAVGLVDFTLNLPEVQVKPLGENSFEEIRAS